MALEDMTDLNQIWRSCQELHNLFFHIAIDIDCLTNGSSPIFCSWYFLHSYDFFQKHLLAFKFTKEGIKQIANNSSEFHSTIISYQTN
jgi:hypothetical protein